MLYTLLPQQEEHGETHSSVRAGVCVHAQKKRMQIQAVPEARSTIHQE